MQNGAVKREETSITPMELYRVDALGQAMGGGASFDAVSRRFRIVLGPGPALL